MPRPRARLPLPGTASADVDPGGIVSSGSTASCWTATTQPILTEPLDEDAQADVCILGAGIAGMTAAYRLAQEGASVVVLDDGAAGSGETGRTTAHFSNALDDRYFLLERRHGRKRARLAAESHTAAIDWVESTVREQGIACGLERVDGHLFLHPSDKATSLDREFDAARRAGIPVEWEEAVPHFEGGRAIRFPRQVQLHPLQYLRGLAEALEERGGRIHTESRGVPKRAGQVECNGHTVRARRVLVCTNAPVSTKVRVHAKQMAFRTYVLAADLEPGSVPHAMWWDTGDHNSPSPFSPYHYVRLHTFDDGGERLIVGGQDHAVGAWQHVDVDPYAALEEWTRQRFPEVRDVRWRWSGQVLEPADHLAFIGPEPGSKTRALATGDSGNGMTHGTIAGLVLADWALGRTNPWASLYDPHRIRLGAVANIAKGQVQAGRGLARFLRRGEVQRAADLEPGEGAVIGRARPRAVYRDEKGTLHVRSAICPHLGCMVTWNPLERSFDCPCHGSRYTAHGAVVNAPSGKGLEPAQLPARDERPSRARRARRVGVPRGGLRTQTEGHPVRGRRRAGERARARR
jgi:glycine/D-amino acid oxidase-like deaminating enzyme/nitrite reductase/ring-hydroxylating ferredoxin subunit